jgi:hypothetical protein
MSISTYSELKTAIAAWAHNTALTNVLADFVTLAESRINRLGLFNEMEQEATLTATPSSRYIALPSGFIEPKGLWLTTYGDRIPIHFLPVEQMPVYDDSGQPDYWTIDGSNIAFDRPASIAYTYVLRYTGKFTLSDASPTNWLLTNHPDVYLYAALMESAVYSRNPEQLPIWKGAFDIALQEVNDAEHRKRSMITLSTELPITATGNILQDC